MGLGVPLAGSSAEKIASGARLVLVITPNMEHFFCMFWWASHEVRHEEAVLIKSFSARCGPVSTTAN